MDPVTHGVVGIAAALSILECRQPGAGAQAKWPVALCGLMAGELPDADRLFDAVFHWYGPQGGGLAYMLYHRGPLHTVLFCVGASLVLAWLTRLTGRIRPYGLHWSEPPPWLLLFVIATTGSLLHLSMDYTNDYGVHPLYPFERWFYGDFMFLAEPTVSAALLPYIFVMFGSRESKALRRRSMMSVAAGVVFLVIERKWLQPFGMLLALAWLVPQALFQLKGPRPRVAWGSLLLVLVCFFTGSRVARARGVQWATQMAVAGQSAPDIVTTPSAANPFCWRVITVSRAGQVFNERLGITSLLPMFVHETDCFSPPKGASPRAACGVALTKPVEVIIEGAKILQLAAFSGRFDEFEQMAGENPRVGATRHFLRAPFWGPEARGRGKDCTTGISTGRQLIGDLRVDYDPDDLKQYSKYSFLPGTAEPYEQKMPVGAPPFFTLPRSDR